jgi:small subunit ribosomal protein S17
MTNKRRRLEGTVVSNKMDKTAVVRIDRSYRHPLYGKVIKDSKKFMAHDENNECQIGDTVIIVESRPLSRHKRWVVQSIVRGDASARTVEVAEVAESPDVIEAETGASAEPTEVEVQA